LKYNDTLATATAHYCL